MDVSTLTREYEQSYRDMLAHSAEATLYATLEYRDLLHDFLGVEPVYLTAIRGPDVIAALPTMIKEGKYGNVLNSLPFFGSHGGVIADSRLSKGEQRNVRHDLLDALLALAGDKGCVLSTIKTSPFETDTAFYDDFSHYAYKADRLAQITVLPQGSQDLSERLMSVFEPRCRWSIKKALKQGFEISSSRKQECVERLQKLHEENIRAVGGPVKPLDFFVKALRHFPDDGQCELLCAMLGGEMVAGLLYFTFRDQVEYFTPAADPLHSSKQPNSLLIYEAMRRSVLRGVKYWNFGGTLPESTGLYMFKRSWGARDHPYHYYTLRHKEPDGFKTAPPGELASEYRWFYVMPYQGRARNGQK